MTLPGRSNFCCVFAAVGIAMLMASCSGLRSGATKPEGEISKVKYYLLDPFARRVVLDDPSIEFERDHLLWGALTHQEMAARAGHYYTVFWKVADRSRPVKVRLEYCQHKTGLTVKTQEVEVTNVRGSNITRFKVIGDEFNTDGGVTCFRVSLVRGHDTIAENKSYMWERK